MDEMGIESSGTSMHILWSSFIIFEWYAEVAYVALRWCP